MKRIAFFSLLAVLVLVGLFSLRMTNDNGPQSLPIGAALPKTEIKLVETSGKEITLKDEKRANGLLVMFTCNTCPYVIMNQSRTKDICAYATKNHIGVVLLNANEGDRDNGNSFSEMQAYAKQQGYDWPYAVDKNSELANAFGASRTPECFLFDKNNKLVYHGAIDDSPGDMDAVKRKHLKIAIDETLSGKEVSVNESKSVGCSIKRK